MSRSFSRSGINNMIFINLICLVPQDELCNVDEKGVYFERLVGLVNGLRLIFYIEAKYFKLAMRSNCFVPQAF